MSDPNAERWQRIKTILDSVLETPIAEREAALRRLCGNDDGLRDEVQSLLAFEEASDHVNAVAGVRIGAWMLHREIGRGGMGAVFLAERADNEYRQQAAIKLIAEGYDARLLGTRLREERQILAALAHPNIALLLDGGTTAGGQPYLVMEYIEGTPVDVYCREKSLNVDERLRLFLQVCDAVQHAHLRLVVHRDIKPSNILVGSDGIPKLLDFGIAKLLAPDQQADSNTTASIGARLMTPRYASPEQLRGDVVLLTSDVYSLGVVLFELLAECSPYRADAADLPAMIHAVCTEEPFALSRAAGLTRKQRQRYSGDLENILAKAMQKQPADRYQTVERLADDIRRYFECKPVSARPATLRYRAMRFLRRHRIAVAAAAAVFFTLAAGVTGIYVQRRAAERRFAELRQLARLVMFEYQDALADVPGATGVRHRMIQDSLSYLDRLSQEASSDVALLTEVASGYRRIGDLQGNTFGSNLGDAAAAITSYRRALGILENLPAGDRQKLISELAAVHARIGNAQWEQGFADQAHSSYQVVLQLRERLAADPKQRLGLASAYGMLGDVAGNPNFPNLGEPRRALQLYEKSLAIVTELHREQPANRELWNARWISLTKVSTARKYLGDAKGAEQSAREALEQAKQMLAAQPKSARAVRAVSSCRLHLIDALLDLGENVEAVSTARLRLQADEELLAADPNDQRSRRFVQMGQRYLARALAAAGSAEEAVTHGQNALRQAEQEMRGSPANGQAALDVAACHEELGRTLMQKRAHVAARLHFDHAASVLEQQVNRNPANIQARLDFASVLERIADNELTAIKRDTAAAMYQRAAREVEKALQARPTNELAQRALNALRKKLATLSASR